MPQAEYGLAFPPIREPVVEPKTGMLRGMWERWLTDLMATYLVAWDDLQFPAQGINVPGGAASPTRSTTTGLLEFAGNLDNVLAGEAQLPHSWRRGGTLHPHLHLRFPTSAAANTRWLFEYDIANPKGNFSNAYGTYTTLSTITVANPQNVMLHEVAEFGELPLPGFIESAVMAWRISRLASSDAADNDVNAAVLLEFDIHYEKIKRGTPTEYPR